MGISRKVLTLVKNALNKR